MYESPVRADPDDLVVLAGEGLGADDTVVYRADFGNEDALRPPSVLPHTSTADLGLADVVSARSAPLELVIRMPQTILSERSYRIWVRTGDGQWSNAIEINDPRPLWFSPSVVYATAAQASLPRYLKVIGRNLEARNRMPMKVRLQGRRTYVLDEPLDAPESGSVERYVEARHLPRTLEPGTYRVAVSVDSKNWIETPGPPLTVVADPEAPPELLVSDRRFGDCHPDDGIDDTACVESAIQSASAAGAAVLLGRGTWDIRGGELVLPEGVTLQGAGPQNTRVVRHDAAQTDTSRALITLLGHNEVRGIRFETEHLYATHEHSRPVLQLGYTLDWGSALQTRPVQDVSIFDNVFDKSFGAIVDGGRPIDRLRVAYNRFGDYHVALELGGDRRNVRSRFGIKDSIVSHNTFVAGSDVDPAHGQGVLVSELGASNRLDFSDNYADGSSREFLNSAEDPPGWRAAFFFHMNDNHEMLLISNNVATCTGDKAGDGEAVALDNNANTFGLSAAAPVVHASSNEVKIDRPLLSTQNGRAVDVASYYVGHWVRVVEGPGVGQVRRITSYRFDPSGKETNFSVEPAWDVTPESAKSLITIAREFWQVYIVGNTVDQRKPPCTKGNVTRPKGGAISIWGESSDVVVEGNRQFDTDGIIFQQQYGADERGCAECRTETTIPSFLEIRGNRIDGEYDWNSACSLSGIMASYAAAPNRQTMPPLLSMGVSISHNQISHADGLDGGAISIQPTWFQGPDGYVSPLVDGIVIHHNRLADISGLRTQPACGYSSSPRVGIRLGGGFHVADTVLYSNSCTNVAIGLTDHADATTRLCDHAAADSCECARGH